MAKHILQKVPSCRIFLDGDPTRCSNRVLANPEDHSEISRRGRLESLPSSPIKTIHSLIQRSFLGPRTRTDQRQDLRKEEDSEELGMARMYGLCRIRHLPGLICRGGVVGRWSRPVLKSARHCLGFQQTLGVDNGGYPSLESSESEA